MPTYTLDRPLTIEESGTYWLTSSASTAAEPYTVTIDMAALQVRLLEIQDQPAWDPETCTCDDCRLPEVTETVLRENVARGARALDVALPFWANHIDPDRLRIQESDRCICGQLRDQYGRIPFDDMDRDLGFFADRDQDCDTLTDIWADMVRERQEVLV
jgi:hypothetical protein